MQISISGGIAAALPGCRLGYILIARAKVQEASPELDNEFFAIQKQIIQEYQLETLSNISRVVAVRAMYKKLKFDPSRYRPSSEALVRRVLQNKGLYRVNTAVDVNNYCSVKFLLPFGLYDAAHINGDIRYAIAEHGSYVNIAGNEVSTEGKPFLTDQTGVFGNPTSDSRRTAVTLATSQLLAVVYAEEGAPEAWLAEVLDYTGAMLIRYNSGQVVEQGIVNV